MNKLIWYKLFLYILTSTFYNNINAQQLELQWAQALTGNVIGNPRIATDSQGNVFISGLFLGTQDFDPGSGSVILKSDSLNRYSGFVASYDKDGNFLNVFAMSGMRIEEMKYSPEGHIVIAGIFSGTVDADPGSGTNNLVSIGSDDIFVAIYQVNGSLVKAISMGGLDYEDLGQMAVDPSGNIYITGLFNDTADFDPGININKLASNSRRNAYFAKYDNGGNLVYANAITNISNATSEGVTIAIDSKGRAIIGGLFMGSVDFDPGAGFSSSVATGEDGFIARYDASGKYLSHFSFDGFSTHLTLDADDNLYITGVIVDSMDADPGPARKMLYSRVTYDTYLIKLDSSGNLVKTKVFYSKNPYFPIRIVSDLGSNIYIIGWMSDTVYFDPKKPIFNNGINDAYIARFNVDLEHMTSFTIGGTSTDVMQGIHVDAKGSVWITGIFRNQIDMDPGQGTTIFNWPGSAVFFGYYIGTEEIVNIQELQDIPVQIYSHGHTIFINNKVQISKAVYVNIYNMTGQLIAHYDYLDQGKTLIELPHIASGIYFVQVTDGSYNMNWKIMLE